MKKILNWFVVCAFVGVLALSFIPEPISAMTGSGTELDPYMIYNVTDLQNMNLHLTAYFELANDINASATSGWNWNTGRGIYEGFKPIGDAYPYFTGSFDGRNYTISNLYIDRVDTFYQGLFGLVKAPSILRDVRLVDANINGKVFVGVLVGCFDGNEANNCHSSGNVKAEGYPQGQYAGGLIGLARYDAIIVGCSSSANVKAESTYPIGTPGVSYAFAGGLIGDCSYPVVVSKSAAYGNIEAIGKKAGAYAGGLLGRGDYAHESFAVGDVVARTPAIGYDAVAGGFVGYGTTQILNGYSRSKVTAIHDGGGNAYAGGFIGYIYGEVGYPAIVDSCFSTGVVIGANAGGFCAFREGVDYISIVNSFWDTQTSGQATSAGGTGKTTAQMKTERTFTDTGWNIGTSSYTLNDEYPFLEWQVPGSSPIWLIYSEPITNYTLYISSTLGGNVTTPGEGTFSYAYNATVSLNTTAEAGYSFYRWSGEISTIANKYSGTTSITILDDYIIIANFQSSSLLPMPVIPVITPEEDEADPSTLPWYDLIHPAAIGLGWRTIDFWSLLIIFVAIAMGVGVMIATGSTLLAAITVAIVLVLGVSMSILSLWVVIVYAIFSGSYLIAVRTM